MKLSELCDVYGLIEHIANKGGKIKDFGTDDKIGAVWVMCDNDEEFLFILDGGAKDENE